MAANILILCLDQLNEASTQIKAMNWSKWYDSQWQLVLGKNYLSGHLEYSYYENQSGNSISCGPIWDIITFNLKLSNKT